VTRLPSKGNDWWLFEAILAAAEHGEPLDASALDALAERIYRMRDGERIQDVFDVRVPRGRPQDGWAQVYYDAVREYVDRHAAGKLAAGLRAASILLGEPERMIAQHVEKGRLGFNSLPEPDDAAANALRALHERFRSRVKRIKGE
jgi:hypothetical protein